MPSLPQKKLLEIYRKLGVQTISESVEKEETSLVDVSQLNQVNPKEILIAKGLVMLILRERERGPKSRKIMGCG